MKILHIEDEADIREIASISLGMLGGHELKQCPSGDVAIAECDGFAPDLLLIDVMMPGLTGPETLLELRKKASAQNIPAVFMTAKASASEIEYYLSLGVQGVIRKPFDPITLSDEIVGLAKTHC